MGAIEIAKYNTEFVKRTEKLLDDYNGEFVITLLVNCLLGLIVMPNEAIKRTNRNFNFLSQDINTIPSLKPIISRDGFSFSPTKQKRGVWIADAKTLKVFLKKIRNGIAHQRIEPKNKGKKWTRVIISDINERNGNNVELTCEFTVRELRQFAKYISREYLNAIV